MGGSNFIPEIWADEIVAAYKQNLVFTTVTVQYIKARTENIVRSAQEIMMMTAPILKQAQRDSIAFVLLAVGIVVAAILTVL